MRIAWVTNNFTPYKSGVTQALLALLPELRALGYEVTVITLDFARQGDDNETSVMRVPSVVQSTWRGNPIALPWLPDRNVYHSIQKLQPDIVHTHHPFLLGMSALKAARLQEIPILFTHHTIYSAYAHLVPLPDCVVRKAIEYRIVWYWKAVDHIIVPSEPIAACVRSQGLGHKVTVLPSGIRPLFTPKKSGIQIKNKRPFTLLVVGRFSPEKNLTLLIDMYARYLNPQEYTLVFAGYGAELHALERNAYYLRAVSPRSVQFIVSPDEKRLLQAFQEADLFLFASYSDTQGLVLAEAMACGIPVVALNGPGQSAIVDNGKNGFLVDSLEEMAACIQRCASDCVLYERLQQHALQTSCRYRPQVVAADLVKVYHQMAGRGQGTTKGE